MGWWMDGLIGAIQILSHMPKSFVYVVFRGLIGHLSIPFKKNASLFRLTVIIARLLQLKVAFK